MYIDGPQTHNYEPVCVQDTRNRQGLKMMSDNDVTAEHWLETLFLKGLC